MTNTDMYIWGCIYIYVVCSWGLILSWVELIMSLSLPWVELVCLPISQRITNILCPNLYQYVVIIQYVYTILKTKFNTFYLSDSNWAVILKKCKYYVCVDFSFCWISIDLVDFAPKQNICRLFTQAFIHNCELHQVWEQPSITVIIYWC